MPTEASAACFSIRPSCSWDGRLWIRFDIGFHCLYASLTTWWPSINGYFARYLRYAQILILEIPPCIPVVKIFACLDLEQTISFMDGHNLKFWGRKGEKNDDAFHAEEGKFEGPVAGGHGRFVAFRMRES